MKKFFAEFKKFITRGNVIDMAVGVIVGSSFTAIVNALSNNILKPLINYVLALILGKDSLSEVYTFLQKVTVVGEDGVETVDLAQSIYIDWGAFINAIINFIIIAFVLFCIVKAINNMKEDASEKKLKKARKAELRANGIKPRDKAAAEAYFAKKKADEEAAAAAEAEKVAADRLANPTTEDLLKQILEQLKK